MRLLIFSDLHAHAFRPYSEILPDGRNSRLQDTLNILEYIYHTCKHNNVDGVLCGGDLFHARSVLNVATFNDVYEAIAKIKTAVKFFLLTVGNHDQSNKLGTIHSTKTFNAVVDVIDQPAWCNKVVDGESLGVYVIPFTDSREAITAAITSAVATWDALEPCPRLLLGHFGVSGAEPGANFVLKTPDLPVLPDLKPHLFDQIFLGHYHMPQELLPNVRFVGAPLQHNWGDTGQTRGVWLYDTNEDGKYHVPAMFTMIVSNFVRITESSLKQDSQPAAGNITRVVYDRHISRDEWAKTKDWLLSKIKVRWAEEWIELPEAQKSASSNSYNPTMDLHAMIDKYVEDEAPNGLNRNLLCTMGHEFLG